MRWRQRWNEHKAWQSRIADVLSSPDNSRIPRVADAGLIVGNYQIMHNGLKVRTDGYYGSGITRLLQRNRGCHEPQEEVVFEAIIATLSPGATIIECGAYWAFYSMWFLSVVQGAHAFLIEPTRENLLVGQENFALNGFLGNFTRAYVGDRIGIHEDGTSIIAIDAFVHEHNLHRVDLLHADIQGAEFDMLKGARELLSGRKISYLFVSTHSVEMHGRCRESLVASGYVELVSIDIPESYSVDGVLVFCSPDVLPPAIPHPFRKPAGSLRGK